MCTVCGIGVLLINLTVTLSPSVNLKVGPGIVPLNVQVFTTFPGAISSSASCAINVYSFRVGDVIVVVELLAVVASASVGPLILLSLSVPVRPGKEITVPIIADAIRIPHSTMIEALLLMSDNLF